MGYGQLLGSSGLQGNVVFQYVVAVVLVLALVGQLDAVCYDRGCGWGMW